MFVQVDIRGLNSSYSTMAKYLLHGTLEVTIYDAENIVNQDRKSGRAPGFLRKVRISTANLNPVMKFNYLQCRFC